MSPRFSSVWPMRSAIRSMSACKSGALGAGKVLLAAYAGQGKSAVRKRAVRG